jgi:hypothetical protein
VRPSALRVAAAALSPLNLLSPHRHADVKQAERPTCLDHPLLRALAREPSLLLARELAAGWGEISAAGYAPARLVTVVHPACAHVLACVCDLRVRVRACVACASLQCAARWLCVQQAGALALERASKHLKMKRGKARSDSLGHPCLSALAKHLLVSARVLGVGRDVGALNHPAVVRGRACGEAGCQCMGV